MIDEPTSYFEQQRAYLKRVHDEITQLNKEAPRAMRRHQWARVAVIVVGAATPVLAAWSAVPRPALALTGAIAVAVGAAAEVFQFQTHAVTMLHTHNALERELTRFIYEVGPYAGSAGFDAFVERIEGIRENANAASRDAWQRSGVSAQSVEQAAGNRPERPA